MRFKILVVGVMKWKRLEFPPQCCLSRQQLEITLLNYIQVPVHISLYTMSLIAPASVNEYPVCFLSNSQCLCLSVTFSFPHVSEEDIIFYEARQLCSVLYQPVLLERRASGGHGCKGWRSPSSLPGAGALPACPVSAPSPARVPTPITRRNGAGCAFNIRPLCGIKCCPRARREVKHVI